MKLFWPVRVSDGAFINQSNLFGANPSMYDQYGLNGHNGLDFVIQTGKSSYYSHDGYVVEATEKTGGYGVRVTQVYQEEGKWWLLVYGHLLDYTAPEKLYNFSDRSKFVLAGEKIGRTDDTGFSTGPHIHLGLYEYDSNGNKLNDNNGFKGAINPLQYLAGESEKPNMSNAIFYHKAGTDEYGFAFPKTSQESLKDMALNIGREDVIRADGSIDFSKAKEVSGL